MKCKRLVSLFIAGSILISFPALAEEDEKLYTNIQDLLDSDRHLLEERFLDASSKLVLNENGYAVEKDEYSDNGQQISRSYYDDQEEPALLADGYHTVKSTFDEEKHKLSDSYFDVDGNPVIIAKGYASISYA